MDYKTIKISKEDHIGTIELNRPKNYNTFSSKLARELNEALLELDKEQEIRVIILKGKGKSFCAGIDVSEYQDKSEDEYKEWVELMEKPFSTISNMKKPVIASVHGHAVANGIGLVAASDLAIVTKKAKLGATAVNIGLFCMGPAIPLYKSLGRKRTLELVLTGKMIDGSEAEDMGLVNHAVSEEKLEERTRDLAEDLANKSPKALQMGKQAFYNQEDIPFEKALKYSNETFARLCSTEDAEEGVEAFLEKRDPNWKEN